MVRAHPTVPIKSITSQERIEALPSPGYQLATMLLRARLLSPTTKYASLTILRLLRRPSQSTGSIAFGAEFSGTDPLLRYFAKQLRARTRIS